MDGRQVLVLCFCAVFGLFIVVALAVVYYRALNRRLSTYALAVDKHRQLLDTDGWWAWVKVKSQGWRTVWLTLVASLPQVLQLLDYYLPQVKDLPWAQVVDQHTANIITLVCCLVIPLVHAHGLAKAAVAQPVE